MDKGKVLALDYGTKRIGVASGDFENKIAFPREVIQNKNADLAVARILELSRELGVVLVVIGLPLNMKEEHVENRVMKSVKVLGGDLEENGVVVEYVDERLSSFEAAEKVGYNKGVDAEAAQVILQRYFDGL